MMRKQGCPLSRSDAVRRYQRGRWGAVEARESLCRENGDRGGVSAEREREGQEMKSTPLYSTRCEGCGGVK